jgi:hypothetical protein
MSVANMPIELRIVDKAKNKTKVRFAPPNGQFIFGGVGDYEKHSLSSADGHPSRIHGSRG